MYVNMSMYSSVVYEVIDIRNYLIILQVDDVDSKIFRGKLEGIKANSLFVN